VTMEEGERKGLILRQDFHYFIVIFKASWIVLLIMCQRPSHLNIAFGCK
jgi:hypothetical protein